MDNTVVQRGTVEESAPKKHEPHARTAVRKRSRGVRLAAFLIILLLALGALAVYGLMKRSAWTAALQLQTNQNIAGLTVAVVRPEKAPAKIVVDLPGQTEAYTDAPIYAQTTGYLKKWSFDIGARVKQGDVLGEIDTPAVDEQFNQAKATLGQAHAALDLSNATYQRDLDLFRRRVIAQQDFDVAQSDLREKQATVTADEAAVGRLQALEEFKLLRAPFDGIVTARNTDIGQMVNAGSGSALFVVAQVDPLRVYINVPESMTGDIKVGGSAELRFSEIPGKTFVGKVVRTARAINPTSRTLLTEIDVPNPSGDLFAGAHVQIRVTTGGDTQSLLIPANTLIFRQDQISVGIVGSDHKVEVRKIKIGKDLGTSLEVVQGLSADDRVILNPSASLATGQTVRIR
jgi:RND family efflux transporter MFP subunit